MTKRRKALTQSLPNRGNITQSYLKELFHYCPNTGVFTRRVSVNNRARKGDIAGSLGNHGYLSIRIQGNSYLCHRLAFLYMVGVWPDVVDHIDRDRQNNSWNNLRSIPKRYNHYNMKNNSDIVGVTKEVRPKYGDRYVGQIMFKGKKVSKGFSIKKYGEKAKELATNFVISKREELGI